MIICELARATLLLNGLSFYCTKEITERERIPILRSGLRSFRETNEYSEEINFFKKGIAKRA